MVLKRPSCLRAALKSVAKIFIRQIADGADTVERHVQIFRRARHARGFHFHDRCAFGAQASFFRRRLSYMVDGGNYACGAAGPSRNDCRPGVATILNGCGYEDVADTKRFVERAAESDIADGGRFRSHQHGGEGAVGAGSVGDGMHFAAFPLAGTRPVHGQCKGSTRCQWGRKPANSRGSAAMKRRESDMRLRGSRTRRTASARALRGGAGRVAQVARGFFVRDPHLLLRHADGFERHAGRRAGEIAPRLW